MAVGLAWLILVVGDVMQIAAWAMIQIAADTVESKAVGGAWSTRRAVAGAKRAAAAAASGAAIHTVRG